MSKVWLRRSVVAALAVAITALALNLAPNASSVAVALEASQQAIVVWVEANPALAGAVYVLSVAAGKLTPVPGGLIMMLIGGFLFGTVVGGLLAAAGSALSAGCVFLVGRRLFAAFVERRLGERYIEVERAVAADGFNYLLAMRLLPVLPAWLVNLLPAAFPLRLRTVLLATFLGVLPLSLITASVGSGLATISERAEEASARLILSGEVLLPLFGLALLALSPVIVRRLSPKR